MLDVRNNNKLHQARCPLSPEGPESAEFHKAREILRIERTLGERQQRKGESGEEQGAQKVRRKLGAQASASFSSNYREQQKSGHNIHIVLKENSERT